MLKTGQTPKRLYNVDMGKFIKLFFIGLFLCFSTQISWAEEYKVLVLPDNIQFDSTNYLIYPDSSVIFASDTINEIKKDGRVKTVSMTEVRDTLRKNTKLNLLTKNALKEYKYNYNIPFVDFKSIASYFGTNKVLIITSQTDVQNYILQRTLWDFLNIPGATVIDPAYKLSTYASLIDVEKEQVLWQGTYYKKIGSIENRMIAQNFAPATEQLEKVKFYSTYILCPEIARQIEAKILPAPIILPNDKPVLNVTNIQQETLLNEIEDTQKSIEFKQNIVVPAISTPKFDNNGETINDL